MLMSRSALLAGVAATLLPLGPVDAASAQNPPAAPTPARDTAQPPAGPAASEQPAPQPADAGPEAGQPIVVTGFRRNREDVLAGTSVVRGVELTRDLRPTI